MLRFVRHAINHASAIPNCKQNLISDKLHWCQSEHPGYRVQRLSGPHSFGSLVLGASMPEWLFHWLGIEASDCASVLQSVLNSTVLR